MVNNTELLRKNMEFVMQNNARANIVVEKIENEGQLNNIRKIFYDLCGEYSESFTGKLLGQGYLFGRPERASWDIADDAATEVAA